MSKLNTKEKLLPIYTHEGAKAVHINAEQQLRRSVMSCLLWEDTFYEDGQSIADRITELVGKVPASVASKIAIEARTQQHLRHAPLWILVAMIQQQYKYGEDRNILGRTIPQVLLRADEPGELLSLYWKDGKKPLTRQMKVGIANAFKSFNEYQLAKYNSRDAKVKLRDVMFLVHPHPKDDAQAELFKRVASNTLVTPDTWEVALSGGADKKETFERLISENKLGGMALLRNLRNMKTAGCDENLVKQALTDMQADRILPFRFVSAARHAPQWESVIEVAMLRCLASFEKLPGKTAIVVDNSGSMYGHTVSAKSDINRSDAACALAVLVREVCESCVVIGYGNHASIVPDRRGFALVEAIKAGPGGGTDTRRAVALAEKEGYERIIVITDEQSATAVYPPATDKAYFINVSTNKNGIGYGKWTHIDGWSESVLSFIQAFENAHD
jgi:60 kDa SS-A/Ro ribonucleoprotein